MKFLKDCDCKEKTVLLRAGFDMPLDEQGNITDDTRIVDTLPTIKYILDGGCKQLIIISHMGRPKGQVVDLLKNDVAAKKLSELLGQPVVKLDGCEDVSIPSDKIVMLENLRFYFGEKDNNEGFAKKLSSYADIFVQDAFSNLHRDHASMTGIPKYMPSYAGLLVEKELHALDITNVNKPLIAILGGSKVSTKFGVIQELLKKVDKLLIGGAMIFTFFKAQGLEIGKSIYEEDQIEAAKLMLNNEKILLPTDVLVASNLHATSGELFHVKNIPADKIGLDLGTETIDDFELALADAKTVVWNGPLGYFENPVFAKSTRHIATYLANSGKKVILGGGDTEAAIDQLGIKEKFFHVSTGGGASLELLANRVLPGVKALEDNEIDFFEV